jgi:F-type H+-transporting ATPase subunit a
VRSLVVDILGKRLEKLTPYFVFLMSYLLLSNTIGILGLANPTGSLTVTLSFGLVMFIGTFVIGFRYQKLSYLTRFCACVKSKKTGKHYPVMINPLNIIEVITPLISISFRLWGNIFAGGVVLTL